MKLKRFDLDPYEASEVGLAKSLSRVCFYMITLTFMAILSFISSIAYSQIPENWQSISTLTNYAANDQNLWGPGEARRLQKSGFIGWEDGASGRVGRVRRIRIPFVGNTYWGAELNGDFWARVGLEHDLAFNLGSMDIEYPVEYTISAPKEARVGDKVKIQTAYSVKDTAKFRTESPNGHFKLDGVLNMRARADATVGFGPRVRADLFSVNVNERRNLINLSTDQPFHWGNDYASLDARFPRVDTVSSLAGSVLSASGSDTFLTARVQLTRLLEAYLGVPLKASFSAGPFAAGYDLINTVLAQEIAAQVAYQFVAKPMITLDINGEIHSLAAGDSLEVVAPVGGLNIRPLYWLDDSVFSNRTGLDFETHLRVDPWVRIWASAFGYSLDWNPLRPTDVTLLSAGWTLFDRQWELQMGQFGGEAFSIKQSVPEPSHWAVGLAMLMVSPLLWRRTRRIKKKRLLCS